MNTIKFKLKDILDNQKYRPEGYYYDVISSGKIHDDYIEIDYDKAIKLVEKYSEKNPIAGLKTDNNIWGPILWKVLHDRTNQYSMDIDSENRWIKIFQSWIPCGICKNHFIKIINELPVDLSSKESYKRWAIDIHNIVNKSLNKPIWGI